MRRMAFCGYFTRWRQNQPGWIAEIGVFGAYRKTQIMRKTTMGKKPKKKVYHREHALDKVMELRKKPSLVFQLVSAIQSQKSGYLLLRDLEKFVGFVEKWNYMAIIEKYSTIFRVFGSQGYRSPPAVTLTEKAESIAAMEPEVRVKMEPFLVRNMRKLLMLSVDCRLPLETIELVANEMGLPIDFKKTLIPMYPQYFRLDMMNDREYLHLENWDSSLAVTAREQRLASEGSPASNLPPKRGKMPRDGNFSGPFAFPLKFPPGFRPNTSYLEEVHRWQKMEFPSPYLNARRIEVGNPKARKRAVAVLHELLSLTMEKRLTSSQIDAFHSEYRLPSRLLLCFIKHHGIFYLTNKGVFSTVMLKEAYDGSSLIEKCPLLEYRDKFLALIGRNEGNSVSCSVK